MEYDHFADRTQEECNCDQAIELKIVLESTQKELTVALEAIDALQDQVTLVLEQNELLCRIKDIEEDLQSANNSL